jgi:transcriptional regulator with GAF, ATPase, and Fis domain
VEAQVIPEEEWRRRERDNILAALRQAGFRISGKGGAAELLDIHPATLTSRLKAFGIDNRKLSGQGLAIAAKSCADC